MTHDILVSLPQFEGSLIVLQNLIKKEEIDIIDIQISKITALFFLESSPEAFFSQGPDLIYISSLFLVWKTRKLLPKEEKIVYEEMQGLGTPFIEMDTFRHIVEELCDLEQKQLPFFSRDISFTPEKDPPAFEEVQLDELAKLFEKLMKKTSFIEWEVEEEFNISSQIEYLEEVLRKNNHLHFEELFSLQKSKGELISLFLALLELIKQQKIFVKRQEKEEDNAIELIISLY